MWLAPYALMSWCATSCVPSGEPSSTITISQSNFLYFRQLKLVTVFDHIGFKGRIDGANASVKVLSSSQTMTGRFFRSLYVGKMIEYLSLAIVTVVWDVRWMDVSIAQFQARVEWECRSEDGLDVFSNMFAKERLVDCFDDMIDPAVVCCLYFRMPALQKLYSWPLLD